MATSPAAVPGLGDFHQAGVELRLPRFEVLEQQGDRRNEHARVPVVVAGFQVLPGDVLGRLLHEFGDREGAGRPADVELAARTDVAEAGGRMGRLDADRDNVSFGRRVDGLADSIAEGAVRGDDLVRGEGAHDRFRIPGIQDGRGQADRGGRILGLAFEHQVRFIQFRKLGFDGKAVRFPRDHEDAAAGKRLQPVIGGADQGTARPCQVVQEFGGGCAGQRPQAGSGSACGNHAHEPVKCRTPLCGFLGPGLCLGPCFLGYGWRLVCTHQCTS
jgi:hypothetical protein